MYHLNAFLKQQGLQAKILEFCIPQMYLATSVADFLREKDTVVPTSRTDLIGYVLTYQPGATHLVGKAMINIVKVDYLRNDDIYGIVKDPGSLPLTCSIEMLLHNAEERNSSDLDQGMDLYSKWYRVDLIGFVFDPKKPVEESELVVVKRNVVFPSDPLNDRNVISYAMAAGFA